MTDALLELRSVSKTYQAQGGPVTPVVDCSFQAGAGEWLGLYGASGCGKTTTLLMAGGLLRPTSGEVVLSGRDLYQLSPDHRAQVRGQSIGFLFQRFHLVPSLNILENVAVAQVAGSLVDATYAKELLDRFGLGDRLLHRPHQLSVGEMQRVALSRALFTRPALLMADEPTGNLDQANADVVLQAFADFCADGGLVVMASHDQRALERCSRQIDLAATVTQG